MCLVQSMKIENYSKFLGTLSSKKRFAIIHLLLEKGPLNVTQICQKLKFEQSTVSHHLKRLSRCHYIFQEKNGKEHLYKLNEKTIKPLLKLIDEHVKNYCFCGENCYA